MLCALVVLRTQLVWVLSIIDRFYFVDFVSTVPMGCFQFQGNIGRITSISWIVEVMFIFSRLRWWVFCIVSLTNLVEVCQWLEEFFVKISLKEVTFPVSAPFKEWFQNVCGCRSIYSSVLLNCWKTYCTGANYNLSSISRYSSLTCEWGIYLVAMHTVERMQSGLSWSSTPKYLHSPL